MGDDKYLFRSYKENDEKQIINVLLQAFKKWPGIDIRVSELDHWKWKFLDNPSGFHIAVIDDNGKIVGCWHRSFSEIKIGDHELRAAQGVDTAILPEYQGKGLSYKLFKYLIQLDEREKIDFSYGYTSNPRIQTTSKETHKHLEGVIKEYIRIKNVKKYVADNDKPFVKTFFGYKFLQCVNVMQQFFKISKIKQIREYSIRNIDVFGDDIDAFYNYVKKSYGFIGCKKMKYLNWRYCDSRTGEYQINLIELNKEIYGYSITTIKNNEGYIVELVCRDDDEVIFTNLMNKCIEFFERTNINVVRYLITEKHPYSEFIKIYGFMDNHSNKYINYYDRHGYLDEVLKHNMKILYQFGDTDLV